MATSRKRPSTGFSEKPKEETLEEKEVDEFLEVSTKEIIEEIEKVEEDKAIVLEIEPTEDPGPRFIDPPTPPEQPKEPKVELKRPRPHPRNTPKFSRIVK